MDYKFDALPIELIGRTASFTGTWMGKNCFRNKVFIYFFTEKEINGQR